MTNLMKRTKQIYQSIWILFLTTFCGSLLPLVTSRDTTGEILLNYESCYDVGAGYVDYVASPGDCQLHCTFRPSCNTWSFRHDWLGRCHLCTKLESTGQVSCGNSESPCKTFGWRATDESSSASSMLNNGISTASNICSGKVFATEALNAASDVNFVINAYKDGLVNKSILANYANKAANILAGETSTCRNKYTAPSRNCRRNNVLFHQLRALLLYVDGNANRAFPSSRDKLRKALFNKYKIFMTDNSWFNARSLNTLLDFYSKLPPHLKNEGILYNAEFAVQTVSDAWKCNQEKASYLGVSNRGFNVFQTQVLQSSEQGFPGDTPNQPPPADLQMVVTRHEVSHQFDRILVNRKANGSPRLQKMKDDLTLASKGSDFNWLRSNVGDSYFQGATQEIIASQVGNQYLHSSSAQLRLAASRLLKSQWNPPTYQTVTTGEATLTRLNKACESNFNIGTFNSAQQCVDAAMNNPSCSFEIMYSTEYPTWGCRCCKSFVDLTCPEEDSLYVDHNLWDVYQYKNSSESPSCTATGIPMSWFLFNVEIVTKPGSSYVIFYENEVDGKSTKVSVPLERDGSGRIISLKPPFCNKIDINYDAAGIVTSVSAHAKTCEFACVDDPTWNLTGVGDCQWVSASPKARCNKVGDDGRRANESCLVACNLC